MANNFTKVWHELFTKFINSKGDWTNADLMAHLKNIDEPTKDLVIGAFCFTLYGDKQKTNRSRIKSNQ